jgi:hypothetical protein
MYHWHGGSAWWWGRKSRNFLLYNLFLRGSGTVLVRYRTTWASGGGSGIVRHGFPRGRVKRGPPRLVKDSVHKILGARIMRGHADMQLIKEDGKTVNIWERGWR